VVRRLCATTPDPEGPAGLPPGAKAVSFPVKSEKWMSPQMQSSLTAMAAVPVHRPPARVRPPRRRNGYEHLEPLFAEQRSLPVEHPRRQVLRDRLVTGYRPVALHIARKHAYRGGDLEDLEQVAALGLIQAVDRFEPDRGIAFLSFAVPTVTGEVLRYFRDRAPVIRVPRRLAAMRPALKRATTELTQRLGRAPRPSELAALLNVGVDLVVDALQAQHAGWCLSLDEPAHTGHRADQNRFDGALAHDDPDLGLVEDRQLLISLIADLSDRDREILLLRFFKGLTQTEIAGRVGVSQMQISRVLAAILVRLRRTMNGPPSRPCPASSASPPSAS
jgi:RNA polymerase sigma-B factor